MLPTTKLFNKYNLWYHSEKDNWTLSGYKKLYEIITIGDFWKLINNWSNIKGSVNKYYILMKDGVNPIWEDPINQHGGCWSFEVYNDQIDKLWCELAVYLVCNQIITDYDDIVGLSICFKKNNKSTIKIWNKDSKNNSLNLINKEIIKNWGTDIIYIVHV